MLKLKGNNMKNPMKPKMAMKSTKVVVKPAAKMMPAKVAVKTTKTVIAKPKPAKVTIGRLRQVSDSLMNQASLSVGGGHYAYKSYLKNKKEGGKSNLGRSANESLEASNRMVNSGLSDYDRAERYNKIIKKSTPKK
jgi:hypothetical protein